MNQLQTGMIRSLLLVLVCVKALTFQSLIAEGEIIHTVLPDAKNVSETCNAENNCVTLSNCSTEPDQCFRSDTTLLFQPEEYQLEKPIVVRDIHNLSICVVNCTQSWYTATIHCQTAAGFAFINVSFFQIQNIHLISCGFPTNKTELAARSNFSHQVYLTNSLSAALQIILSFHSTIDNVNITNSKGNGLFWVNPLGRSHIQNSVIAYTNYDLISKQMSGSINCKNMTVGCEGGNIWILFVDMDCNQKTNSVPFNFFAIHNTEISFGINLNNRLWGPRYAAGLGVTFSQTSFDIQFHIENSNIHDNVGDAGANVYCRIMNFVSNSSLQIVNTSMSYGNRPFIDPQYMAYWDQAPGIFIDIDSENVIDYMNRSLVTCNLHHKATHTNISLSNVTMKSNLGGGMKVFLSDSGYWTVPCCFQVQISNTLIDGSYIYYYTDSDFRSSLALLIQESKESKAPLLNVSLSNLTISNCYVEHTDDSWLLADYPKISTILVGDASSVYFHNTIIEGNMAVGISALSSNMNMDGINTVRNNSGIYGGAMSLDAYSIIYLHQHSILRIVNNNSSNFGGGISINQGLIRNYETPCSYQLLPDVLSSKAQVVMKGNSAGIAGHAIYGGELLGCSQNAQKLVHESKRKTAVEIFLTTFKLEPTPSTSSELSSVAIGLCYCTHDSKNCRISAIDISVYPGQNFILRAVGIGYYGGIGYFGGISPAVIRQSSTIANVTLKTAEPQSLGTACGDLTFEVEAPENISDISIQLTAEGSVFPLSFSKLLRVDTMFCPVGFNWEENRCICSSVLSQLSVQCNINNQSFYRSGTVWISFTNDSILYYEHCPSEYCKAAGVHLNASTPDNQCDFNHSGVLCGSCKAGFSITLGSSRCAPCTDKFLGLIPAFALAGILLVTFLTVLNLTVATGTINGLIFYANILQAARETFVLTANSSRIMSVFIAWVNLDLGLEVCFSSKLDIYAKTFLQFIFPVYIWVLVMGIIVSSHYSTTIARLTGNNSVPVLATLFLLSYAKIQRAVIAALSFTFIHEERGDSFAVWIFDGNLRFLSGKHIPLFLTSVLFTVAFILPLTLLLLSESCLRKFRHYRVVRIMTWLKPLLDAYQGPYKVSFRFWTGFMLVIRSMLLVSIALNVSGDSGINLLVIILVTSFTVLAGLFKSGGVYKNLPLNILDSFYLYNLVGFAVWTLFNRYQYNSEPETFTEKQSWASYAMLGTAAIIFSLTLLFHAYQKLNRTEIFSTFFKWIQSKKQQKSGSDGDETTPVRATPPTFSYVSIREPLLDETV